MPSSRSMISSSILLLATAAAGTTAALYYVYTQKKKTKKSQEETNTLVHSSVGEDDNSTIVENSSQVSSPPSSPTFTLSYKTKDNDEDAKSTNSTINSAPHHTTTTMSKTSNTTNTIISNTTDITETPPCKEENKVCAEEALATRKDSLPSSPRTIGRKYKFSLSWRPTEQVKKCQKAIGGRVLGITTNGTATVFIRENLSSNKGGDIQCTRGLPDGLQKALSLSLSSPTSASFDWDRPSPSYVSLGTPAMIKTEEDKLIKKDRFFVAFDNGTYAYEGPDDLSQQLDDKNENEKNLRPRSIAFGASYDTYFIVFHHGSFLYNGSDIPQGLLTTLRDLEDEADGRQAELLSVSLGPSGEWFLRTSDGRVWWGNVIEELDDSLRRWTEYSGQICSVEFGRNGSYIINYDSAKATTATQTTKRQQ